MAMKDRPHIGIIGAGAMGSLYGAALANAGFSVSLVDRWLDHVDAINRDGLLVQQPTGQLRVAPVATVDARLLAPVDLAVVFVDTNSTREAALAIAPVLKDDGVALTLQNGIGNRETLVEVLGADRVMAGLTYASAAVVAPGAIAHTHAGPTWLGEADGLLTDRLAQIQAWFAAADLDPVVVDDITALIWDKWILNCAINALCAITGLRQGEIPRTAEVETYQDRILDELFAIIAARGIRLANPRLREAIKQQCWKKFNKPSMQQHMEAGKRTEIDALNGAAVRLGAEVGVATPFNEALTLLIRGREAGRRNELGDSPPDYAALEADAARNPRPSGPGEGSRTGRRKGRR